MPNNKKKKGYIFENFIIKDLRKNNILVERLGQANQADMIIDGFGVGEAKCWKKGLKTIYKILGKNAFAVIKWQSNVAKAKQPIVFLPYENFVLLLKEYVRDSK